MQYRRTLVPTIALIVALSACADAEPERAGAAASASAPAPEATPAPAPSTPVTDLEPNETGLVPVLEYHLIEEGSGQWRVPAHRFREQLQTLYDRGYRPVSVAELVDGRIDLPRGASPVVFTFDDASPSQFRYVEGPDGALEIDPTSAVGVWLDFAASHPGWENKAVFCLLSAAEAGRSFFGDKGIEGQKTEWRHRKVKFLADQGFELCNHTLYHARLDKLSDAQVQEFMARLQMAVDSAVPGYRIRTMALPLGMWPKNRMLAYRGSWTDPRTGRTVTYDYDAVLEVAGGPNVSPHDPKFDPLSVDRVIVHGDELKRTLDRLDASGKRYVSDGDPRAVARPADAVSTPATPTPAASAPAPDR